MSNCNRHKQQQPTADKSPPESQGPIRRPQSTRQAITLVGKGWIGNRADFFPHSSFSALNLPSLPSFSRLVFSLPSGSSLRVLFSFFSFSVSFINAMSAQDQDPNGSSSHMMKTTKRGRPFLKVHRSSFLSFTACLFLALDF